MTTTTTATTATTPASGPTSTAVAAPRTLSQTQALGRDVTRLMTLAPVTVQMNSTVGEAAELLDALAVRHLPVLDGETLVGIVSDRDLRGSGRRVVDCGPPPEASRPVSEVMSTGILAVRADDDVRDAVDTMIRARVGALPVVDAYHRVVGIVSYVDVLRAIRDVLDHDCECHTKAP